MGRKKQETIEVFEVGNEVSNAAHSLILSRVDESGIDPALQAIIKQKFIPIVEEIRKFKDKAFQIVVSSESQKEEIAKARELRLKAKNTRINADKIRKALKEDSIKTGKVIQDAFNIIEGEIDPIEEHLKAQEEFVERMRQARIDRLQEERYEIAQPLAEFIPMNLRFGEMDQEDFDKLVAGARAKQVEEERRKKEFAEAEAIAEKQKELKAQRIYDLRSLIDFHPEPESFMAVLGGLSDEDYQGQVKILKEKKAVSDKWKADEELKAKRFAELGPYLHYGPPVDVNTIHELTEMAFVDLLNAKIGVYNIDVKLTGNKNHLASGPWPTTTAPINSQPGSNIPPSASTENGNYVAGWPQQNNNLHFEPHTASTQQWPPQPVNPPTQDNNLPPDATDYNQKLDWDHSRLQRILDGNRIIFRLFTKGNNGTIVEFKYGTDGQWVNSNIGIDGFEISLPKSTKCENFYIRLKGDNKEHWGCFNSIRDEDSPINSAIFSYEDSPPDIFAQAGVQSPFEDPKQILLDMAGNFRNLAWPILPDHAPDQAKQILFNTKGLIEKVVNYIETNANKLS